MSIKLEDAKKYISLTLQGESKRKAAASVHSTYREIEKSEAYKLLHTTMANAHHLQLTKDLQDLQTKTVKAQAELLDQGSALLNQAETLDDKLKAQENQRRNLETTVIERASSWNGPDRNHDANEASILEGVILP